MDVVIAKTLKIIDLGCFFFSTKMQPIQKRRFVPGLFHVATRSSKSITIFLRRVKAAFRLRWMKMRQALSDMPRNSIVQGGSQRGVLTMP